MSALSEEQVGVMKNPTHDRVALLRFLLDDKWRSLQELSSIRLLPRGAYKSLNGLLDDGYVRQDGSGYRITTVGRHTIRTIDGNVVREQPVFP